MRRRQEPDGAHFWLRTNADGSTEIAPDVDGAPGEFGTEDVRLGTLGAAPWWRRVLRRFVDWVPRRRGR